MHLFYPDFLKKINAFIMYVTGNLQNTAFFKMPRQIIE